MNTLSETCFILLLVITLMLAGCGSFNTYTVRKGDTLYSISFRYGQDYKQVAEWNHIDPPYIISLGQILHISPPSQNKQHPAIAPAGKGITDTASASGSPATNPSVKPSTPQTTDRQTTSTTVMPRQTPPAYPREVSWQWPVRGDIIQTFAGRQPGRQGIDIAAARGTTIKAAASGRIVYAGEGLSSYGKLIIIKHNEQYLSAYAHNRVMLVKEGQNVDAGDAIAEMGDTGTDKVKLHFEVRKKGKPVDPLRYLPK